MLGRKSRTGARQTNATHNLNRNFPFDCLVPVRLLLPSMAVLYHENGKLQRAYQLGVFTELTDKLFKFVFNMNPCGSIVKAFGLKRLPAQDTFHLRLKTLKPIPCSAAHE